MIVLSFFFFVCVCGGGGGAGGGGCITVDIVHQLPGQI